MPFILGMHGVDACQQLDAAFDGWLKGLVTFGPSCTAPRAGRHRWVYWITQVVSGRFVTDGAPCLTVMGRPSLRMDDCAIALLQSPCHTSGLSMVLGIGWRLLGAPVPQEATLMQDHVH